MTRALVVAVVAVLLSPAGAAPRGGVVRVEHRDPSTLPSRGPANAPVRVELFFSPNSNATARLPSFRALERLQASHPTRIRLVYRVVKRAGKQQIAIAAMEANAQGKFDQLMDQLHEERSSMMLTKDKVFELAERAGMDLSRLATAIAEGRYNDVFEANDQRLGRLLHTQSASLPAALFNSRSPRVSLGAPSDTDLERAYVAAYDRALDLLDRGVPPRRLAQAFDDQALRAEQPFVMAVGDDDDDDDDDDGGDDDPAPVTDHRLARPPLDLTGMPSFGRAEARSAMPVVVLCRPDDTGCYSSLGLGRRLQKIYPDDIRVVWAPWFDVSRDDAARLALLGDVVLCAEQLASSPDDLDESPGWTWITRQLELSNRPRRRGQILTAEQMIDKLAAELEVDSRKLSACRARLAGRTLDWIARARRSGVTRSPAVVIGGRIYEGLNHNPRAIQQLIEAELAPGVLARCATIGCATE